MAGPPVSQSRPDVLVVGCAIAVVVAFGVLFVLPWLVYDLMSHGGLG